MSHGGGSGGGGGAGGVVGGGAAGGGGGGGACVFGCAAVLSAFGALAALYDYDLGADTTFFAVSGVGGLCYAKCAYARLIEQRNRKHYAWGRNDWDNEYALGYGPDGGQVQGQPGGQGPYPYPGVQGGVPGGSRKRREDKEHKASRNKRNKTNS